MMTDRDQRLARIEASMVSKGDLAAALAGVAQHVAVAALGTQLRALRDDLAISQSDVRVRAATVDRIARRAGAA
jgi:hypothetical protein